RTVRHILGWRLCRQKTGVTADLAMEAETGGVPPAWVFRATSSARLSQADTSGHCGRCHDDIGRLQWPDYLDLPESWFEYSGNAWTISSDTWFECSSQARKFCFFDCWIPSVSHDY